MVVPILTGTERLARMVASVDEVVEHLVIIDNGAFVDWDIAKDNPFIWRTSVVRMPSNLGVSGSWNLGIKATPHAPWWLIVNYDTVWPAGSLAQFDRPDAAASLVLSGGAPEWCAFSIGEQVVRKVGLFDEALHPAYFEDNDYQRRCEAAGVPIIHSGIPVAHDNSSTLRAGYAAKNSHTFEANAVYYADKVQRQDLTAGAWSLDRRREQSWD